jgi:hypothetical protein
MHWTGEIERGDWIRERLRGWGVVGSTVPRGFNAYARVFHPAEGSWRDAAAHSGSTWHPAMQWDSIDPSGALDRPDVGRIDLSSLAALAALLDKHTTTPDDATAGIWEGFGELRSGGSTTLFASVDGSASPFREDTLHPDVHAAVARGPLLELPGRAYVLRSARVAEFVDTDWPLRAGIGWSGPFGPTPNLLWPADHAWAVASEIDFDSTLVGGSRALIDAVLASPALEVAEVTEDTDMSSAGDTVNPRPSGMQELR